MVGRVSRVIGLRGGKDLVMIVKAEELSAAQKSAIEQILGRQILEAETISVRAFTSQVPTEAEEQAASEKIRKFLDEPGRRRPPVSDEEFEAAFLEAMRSVRPHFTPVS
jgi:hypothetical protein